VITTTGRSATAARGSSYTALVLSDAPPAASTTTCGVPNAAGGLAAEVGSRCAHPASAAARASTQAAASPDTSFERFMCVTSNADVRSLEAGWEMKFCGGGILHRTFTCAHSVTSEAASVEAASAPSPRLSRRIRCDALRWAGPSWAGPFWAGPLGAGPSWSNASRLPGVQTRRVPAPSTSLEDTRAAASWPINGRSTADGPVSSRLACHWRAHKLDPQASTIVAAVRNQRAVVPNGPAVPA